MKRTPLNALGLVLLGVLFIGLIALANRGLRGARMDLTANKLYTLAPGSRNIVGSLKEPVNLYFYFSSSAADQFPPIKNYAVRVQEFLQELAARSNGKLRLQVIDPEPSSEDEDRASEAGLRALPIGAGGETLYFGLAATNATDGKANIEFFDYQKERFLEYDVVKLIQQLATPKKAVVGWLTGLPMAGSFDQQAGRPTDPWVILDQAQQQYDVRMLDSKLTQIEPAVDVLVIVHPKNLPPPALLAIDQFALRGGRILLFVDPSAEGDTEGAEPGNPLGAMGVDRKSNFAPLLAAWGVDFDNSKVLGDRGLGLSVTVRQGAAPTRHIGVIGLRDANLTGEDVVTGGLRSIILYSAGAIRPAKGATTRFEPLLRSSADAALLGGEKFQMLMDPAVLLDGFKPQGQFSIAARVSGTVNTAFPGQAPLKTSSKPLNAVIVADSDLLQDFLWLESNSLFGQRVVTPTANNGDFVLNSLENLAGSNDLISLRGRGSYSRPFDRVEDLRRSAESRFRDQERRLDAELATTEQKLAELQSRRSDTAATILSAEQKAELDRFGAERSRIRRELRTVKLDLNRDIEALGRNVKLFNIVAWPLLVAGLALLYPAWRKRRNAAIRMLEQGRTGGTQAP
jgi:ABC-type uncharacterized transport system involved in gliding motility auxiliary subunit